MSCSYETHSTFCLLTIIPLLTSIISPSNEEILKDMDENDTPHLLKSLTNFILVKFNELATLMVPTILAHARFTSEALISS